MNRNSRLSVTLHVLMHVHEAPGVVTSEALARQLGMNPVVLRRALAGLREAGIVRSEKGRGGGWRLAQPLASIALADVYDALGITNPFGIGWRAPSPRCLLERTANEAIGSALADAEATLKERLEGVTVGDLLDKARRQARKRGVSRHRAVAREGRP